MGCVYTISESFGADKRCLNAVATFSLTFSPSRSFPRNCLRMGAGARTPPAFRPARRVCVSSAARHGSRSSSQPDSMEVCLPTSFHGVHPAAYDTAMPCQRSCCRVPSPHRRARAMPRLTPAVPSLPEEDDRVVDTVHDPSGTLMFDSTVPRDLRVDGI